MIIYNAIWPMLLFSFGVSWYLHVDGLLTGRITRAPKALGLLLFFGPLTFILVSLFSVTGAHGAVIGVFTVFSVITTMFLFTSGVIKRYDGAVITVFMTLNTVLYMFVYIIKISFI